MPMRTLDGAILVRNTAVVPARCHIVVLHQRLVSQREIILGIAVQIAECGRETIAAMLAWRSSKHPQRVLQTLGQRDKALTAEHDMGMLEAREGEPEVVEPMSQHDTGDGDAEDARVGEVGQSKPAGFVLLTKDHVLLGAGQGSPAAHSPFQRASDAGADLRMAPPDLVEPRNGPNAGSRLQDRNDLVVPNLG